MAHLTKQKWQKQLQATTTPDGTEPGPFRNCSLHPCNCTSCYAVECSVLVNDTQHPTPDSAGVYRHPECGCCEESVVAISSQPLQHQPNTFWTQRLILWQSDQRCRYVPDLWEGPPAPTVSSWACCRKDRQTESLSTRLPTRDTFTAKGCRRGPASTMSHRKVVAQAPQP